MAARRMLLIVAVLMGVTALSAGLAAPPERRGEAPEPTATAAPGGRDGGVTVVERTLPGRGGDPRTVAIEQGDILRLTVEAEEADSVELVGLDRIAAVAPGTPAMFDVLADRPGLYPVELLEAGDRLGAVRVTPDRE